MYGKKEENYKYLNILRWKEHFSKIVSSIESMQQFVFDFSWNLDSLQMKTMHLCTVCKVRCIQIFKWILSKKVHYFLCIIIYPTICRRKLMHSGVFYVIGQNICSVVKNCRNFWECWSLNYTKTRIFKSFYSATCTATWLFSSLAKKQYLNAFFLIAFLYYLCIFLLLSKI